MGILRWDSTPKSKVFAIALNCLYFGFVISFIISVAWFTFFTARTPGEHTKGFFILLSELLVISWYAILFWHKNTINELFNRLDAIVEQRE